MKIHPYFVFKIIILFGALSPLAFWLYVLAIEWRDGCILLCETLDILIIEIPVVIAWIVSLVIVIFKEFIEEAHRAESQKFIAS